MKVLSTTIRIVNALIASICILVGPAFLITSLIGLVSRNYWACVVVITPPIVLFAILDSVPVRIFCEYIKERKRGIPYKISLWPIFIAHLFVYGWFSTDKKRIAMGPWYWNYYNSPYQPYTNYYKPPSSKK